LATTGIAGFDNNLMIRAIVQEGVGANARMVELSPNGERRELSAAELKQLAVQNKTLGMNTPRGPVSIEGAQLSQTANAPKSSRTGSASSARELTGNRVNRMEVGAKLSSISGISTSAGSGSVPSIESLTGYNVYRSEDGVNFSFLVNVDASNLTYSDNTVTNGTDYWYYVTAVYTEGESDPSNTVTATPMPSTTVSFFDDFDAYTAGVQLAVQNSSDWTTWSNLPGSAEDPFVSDAHALSGANAVVIAQNNDLVKEFAPAPITSGVWKLSWQMYIPSGGAGYFNTLAEFAGTNSTWAMQVYFDAGGAARLDAGGASAATFAYAYDTWMPVVVIVDLETDAAEFWLDGTMIYSWQYTLGTFGTPIPLQLDANNFFGATAVDEMYIDDYSVMEVLPVEFFDDFEAYTAGVQLVVQNSTDWTTWSNLPGSGEDPFVSDAHAFSGANSVVIAQNNDLVRLHGEKTSDSWGMRFQVYIPSGKAGYFNTLAGFAPNPNNWGMEVYFDVGGGGRILGGSATAVTFNWTADSWQEVNVIVDLDQDIAQFWFDGNKIHEWQWTAGASGGGSPLQLDANDFFGATADDEMYFDDYWFGPQDIILGIDDNQSQLPQEFAIEQNYPNPFNPTTTIKYALRENSDVTLQIYNVLGQLVKTLVNTKQTAGFKEVQWDGTNDFGVKVASGIYIYRIQANDFVMAKKMIMMK
jgi:hypothetical protein